MDKLLMVVAAVGFRHDAPRSCCNDPYDKVPPFHAASFTWWDPRGGILKCILNLHDVLHSTVTGSLLVSSHPAYHKAACRSNLRLGHPRPHLATAPWRWRAALILDVHPADAITSVPQGAEFLAPAPDGL